MSKYKEKMYYKFKDLEHVKLLNTRNKVVSDKLYYPSYHIAPPYGLLNDPNGLVYYNGMYHIFYQFCPNGVVHGLKSWRHITTTNFIDYEDMSISLTPDVDFDNFGVYSGGAYVDGDNLNLLYTGNQRDEDDNYKRYPNQCLAVMDSDLNIISKEVFLHPDFNFHTEHFRDPMKYKEFIIIGAQDNNKLGQIAIYNLKTKQLSYLENNLTTSSAYMYECPNVFELASKEVLIYSPQGLARGSNDNIYDVYYSISKLDSIKNNKWDSNKAYKLDYGFDFYAPQVFQHDGRSIMYSWLGQATETLDIETMLGWSQMLTMPREIKLIDDKLYQLPLDEINNLKVDKRIINTEEILTTRSFNLLFSSTGDFNLIIGNDKNYLKLQQVDGVIYLDRGNTDILISEEYGLIRSVNLNNTNNKFDIYVDKSAIEIFINDGLYTMTSRFYLQDMDKIVFDNLDDVIFSDMNNINMNFIKGEL